MNIFFYCFRPLSNSSSNPIELTDDCLHNQQQQQKHTEHIYKHSLSLPTPTPTPTPTPSSIDLDPISILHSTSDQSSPSNNRLHRLFSGISMQRAEQEQFVTELDTSETFIIMRVDKNRRIVETISTNPMHTSELVELMTKKELTSEAPNDHVRESQSDRPREQKSSNESQEKIQTRRSGESLPAESTSIAAETASLDQTIVIEV
jgi:hypothetical protein